MSKSLPELKKCKNVGQLIKELEKLPKTLPIYCGMSKAVKPVVFNDGEKAKELGLDRHLSFEDPEEW